MFLHFREGAAHVTVLKASTGAFTGFGSRARMQDQISRFR